MSSWSLYNSFNRDITPPLRSLSTSYLISLISIVLITMADSSSVWYIGVAIQLVSIAKESAYNVATSLDSLDGLFILLIAISIILGSIQNSDGLSLKIINISTAAPTVKIRLLMQSEITPIVPFTLTPAFFAARRPSLSFIKSRSASSSRASKIDSASTIVYPVPTANFHSQRRLRGFMPRSRASVDPQKFIRSVQTYTSAMTTNTRSRRIRMIWNRVCNPIDKIDPAAIPDDRSSLVANPGLAPETRPSRKRSSRRLRYTSLASFPSPDRRQPPSQPHAARKGRIPR